VGVKLGATVGTSVGSVVGPQGGHREPLGWNPTVGAAVIGTALGLLWAWTGVAVGFLNGAAGKTH
jgi:hypothetical protein